MLNWDRWLVLDVQHVLQMVRKFGSSLGEHVDTAERPADFRLRLRQAENTKALQITHGD